MRDSLPKKRVLFAHICIPLVDPATRAVHIPMFGILTLEQLKQLVVYPAVAAVLLVQHIHVEVRAEFYAERAAAVSGLEGHIGGTNRLVIKVGFGVGHQHSLEQNP